MPKRNLTDRGLRALKPAPPGRHYDVMDTGVPGFGVRVSDTGRRTFIVIARYPGGRNPTRRAIAEFGVLSLEAARSKARDWHELIKRGIDPRDHEQRARLVEQTKRRNTFAAVAADFIAEKLPGERKGHEVAKDIKREFLPRWADLPISEITDLDVLSVIRAKKRSAPAAARNLLGVAKRLFGWAVHQRVYGLAVSPAAGLLPTAIIGEKPRVDRVLSNAELQALWRAASCMGYPYGPVYQLLILTALRLNEAADASWAEFDLTGEVWTIPASRMKGKNSKARAHAVPLTSNILAILKTLPRFKRGPFLFSTSFGEKPVWVANRVKRKADARMLRTLRALARVRGDDPDAVELEPWTNHDIRRTVRSNLSRLRVTEEAREAVLAHVRPGIKGTYDHHDYLDEKREALELWAARLRTIVEPPPANVVTLASARAHP